jgi:hypothetical protein
MPLVDPRPFLPTGLDKLAKAGEVIAGAVDDYGEAKATREAVEAARKYTSDIHKTENEIRERPMTVDVPYLETGHLPGAIALQDSAVGQFPFPEPRTIKNPLGGVYAGETFTRESDRLLNEWKDKLSPLAYTKFLKSVLGKRDAAQLRLNTLRLNTYGRKKAEEWAVGVVEDIEQNAADAIAVATGEATTDLLAADTPQKRSQINNALRAEIKAQIDAVQDAYEQVAHSGDMPLKKAKEGFEKFRIRMVKAEVTRVTSSMPTEDVLKFYRTGVIENSDYTHIMDNYSTLPTDEQTDVRKRVMQDHNRLVAAEDAVERRKRRDAETDINEQTTGAFDNIINGQPEQALQALQEAMAIARANPEANVSLDQLLKLHQFVRETGGKGNSVGNETVKQQLVIDIALGKAGLSHIQRKAPQLNSDQFKEVFTLYRHTRDKAKTDGISRIRRAYGFEGDNFGYDKRRQDEFQARVIDATIKFGEWFDAHGASATPTEIREHANKYIAEGRFLANSMRAKPEYDSVQRRLNNNKGLVANYTEADQIIGNEAALDALIERLQKIVKEKKLPEKEGALSNIELGSAEGLSKWLKKRRSLLLNDELIEVWRQGDKK